jgi:16S rRNA processing protein RimM
MGCPVSVGRVARAHGIRGEVVVQRFGEGEEVLAEGAKVQCRKGDHEFTLTVEASRPHKKHWIVSFDGMENRNEAETLSGTLLFVDSDTLPALPDRTYYNFQLLGLLVVTSGGEDLGRVEDILETGTHDVIVVQGPEGEALLPSIPQVVRDVDLEAGEMHVHLLPGLIPEPSSAAKKKRGKKKAESGREETR